LIYKKLHVINSFIKIYSFLKRIFNRKYRMKIEKVKLIVDKRQPLSKDLIRNRNFWANLLDFLLPSGYLFRKK